MSVRARGIVRSGSDPVRVVSEAGGRIRKIYVREGSEVRLGDPLMQLDSREILRRIDALESRIHFTELRLSSTARVTRLPTELAALYHDRDQAHQALDRLTIRSPADGRISSRVPLRAGEVLAAAATVAVIAPAGRPFVIESMLSASDRAYVTGGQRVRLQTGGLPYDQYNSFDGTVLSLSETHTGAYLVRIIPAPYSPSLDPGMTFQAHFVTRQERLAWLLFDKVRSQFK